MKLQDKYRLLKEDFDDEFKPLVDKLNNPININFEQLYEMSNRNVSLADNISCTLRTVSLILDSNGIPKGTTQFKLDKKTYIIGTQVLDVQGDAFPVATPFITGTRSGDSYIIRHIAGLPSNVTFNVTIVVFHG